MKMGPRAAVCIEGSPRVLLDACLSQLWVEGAQSFPAGLSWELLWSIDTSVAVSTGVLDYVIGRIHEILRGDGQDAYRYIHLRAALNLLPRWGDAVVGEKAADLFCEGLEAADCKVRTAFTFAAGSLQWQGDAQLRVQAKLRHMLTVPPLGGAKVSMMGYRCVATY